jgi:hypothetical protein
MTTRGGPPRLCLLVAGPATIGVDKTHPGAANMATFDLVLQTAGSLHTGGESSDFVSAYKGIIHCTRGRDGKVFKVGRVRAYRVHADLAGRAGETIFDVCDAHSQDLQAVYLALFDPEADDLKADVRTQFECFDSDVLVLDYVLLAPRWRGLRLGLLAARKLVDMVGGGCGLTVAYIAPLSPDAKEFKGVPAGWLPRPEGRDAEREAKKKLRRHFRRMGFQRVKGTRFHALSMARLVPTLEDLLRPRR